MILTFCSQLEISLHHMRLLDLTGSLIIQHICLLLFNRILVLVHNSRVLCNISIPYSTASGQPDDNEGCTFLSSRSTTALVVFWLPIPSIDFPAPPYACETSSSHSKLHASPQPTASPYLYYYYNSPSIRRRHKAQIYTAGQE
ncbi:MAG: hypothetical protein QOE37_2308 [Microbacteriaceae bacterium]|nr:hypothetical protein [Microbacteriaceae bacterium]